MKWDLFFTWKKKQKKTNNNIKQKKFKKLSTNFEGWNLKKFKQLKSKLLKVVKMLKKM